MTPEQFGLPAERAHDIGHGSSITFVEYEGQIVGINEAHKNKDGQVCLGFVLFADTPASVTSGAPQWHVESANPLTLSPSILCRSCGNHGFIREGKWVPA